MSCNTVTVEGGAGSGLCGSMFAGTTGEIELVGGVSEIPDIRNFSPAPGAAIDRLSHLRFDVTDDTGELLMMFVTALFPDGTCECVWDGDAFTPRYSATSSRVAVDCGYRFTVRRAGGWMQTPLRLDIVAIDLDSNVGRSETAFA